MPSVVPSITEQSHRELGRNVDVPGTRNQGASYPWTVPKTKELNKNVKSIRNGYFHELLMWFCKCMMMSDLVDLHFIIFP